MNNKQMENIKNYILKNKGITLDIETMENTKEKKGFSVSLEGYEETTNNIKETMLIVKKYIDIVKQLNKKNYFVGVWYNIDDGLYYIDISIITHRKRDAEEIGKKNKQLAIYDLKNNKSIYLNYDIKFYSIYKKIYNNINEVIDYKIITTLDKLEEVKKYLNITTSEVYHIINNLNKNYIIFIDKVNIQEL